MRRCLFLLRGLLLQEHLFAGCLQAVRPSSLVCGEGNMLKAVRPSSLQKPYIHIKPLCVTEGEGERREEKRENRKGGEREEGKERTGGGVRETRGKIRKKEEGR